VAGEKQLFNFITKILKDGRTKMAVRIVSGALKVKRFCDKCRLFQEHDEHKDGAANTYYFCGTCGRHN